MKIYFDLDGVIRNLAVMIWGKEPDSWDEILPFTGNSDLFSWVKNNSNILLEAPPTEYCKVIRKYNPIIMTCQPESWKSLTERWINKNCPEFSELIYVENIEDKIGLLSEKDWLVEDYPNFLPEVYQGNLLLIDKPYNRNCDARGRVFNVEALDLYLNEIIKRNG